MGVFGSSARIFNSWSKGQSRPPFEGAYIYLLAIFTGYLIADLGILSIRPSMLPTQPPPMRPAKIPVAPYVDVSKYSPITKRNMFNQDGKIAPPLVGDGGGFQGIDAAPVASQLPLKLEGTLVHANPKKSVATITVKSRNEARSVMVDQEIDGLARVTAIERRKVIFRNLNNSRLEFIEIPKDSAVTFGMKEPAAGGGEVQQRGETEFTMRRADLNKYTSQLGDILQQARVVPNIIPGSGGRVDGFRFVAIQPNSIFEKLGFKPMDVIKKVNGEEVNSPTKGMEFYNALKNEPRVQITVERNGREETLKYDITE